jgi:hypothetical protein
VFSQCTFYTNWAGGQGGGVYSVEGSPTLKGCTFRDNEAGEQGGGMYAEDTNAVWVNCTFHANWGGDGGAVCITEQSDCRITSCRFVGNGGHNLGGAVMGGGRSVAIADSLFSGNLAMVDGGALAVTQGSGVVTHCTFNRNLAQGKQAGQTLAVYDARTTVANCVLWDSVDITVPQIAVARTIASSPALIVSYSDVLGGAAAVIRRGAVTVTWGKGNLDADPSFQSPAGTDRTIGTLDDDLRLRAGSPCLDAGDDTAVPADTDDLNGNGDRLERLPLDLGGQPRFVNRADAPDTGVADTPLYPGIADIGAYELSAN